MTGRGSLGWRVGMGGRDRRGRAGGGRRPIQSVAASLVPTPDGGMPGDQQRAWQPSV
ncbi:hypothetical protein [Halobaculum limi]|uniref:hypothetical protein n=1 Tax=Halobaculum limi TaxID=3031916 RepID=UPI0024055332|nr:hypothetical protein [Halobaculum sp. YSMS11]